MDTTEGDDHAHLFVFANSNKAGMNNVDKVKTNQIIYEMSKNSDYFKHAAYQDTKTNDRVESMLKVLSGLSEIEEVTLKKVTAKKLADFELRRDLSRICCVLDMDMFFAACEIRDDSKLKDVPLAVGGDSMICTANYIARKYGVRSAMPGFIAKKLCPQLVFVSPNFQKYEAVSSEMKAVIAQYDPHYRSFSLDEVYMDLTDAALERVSIGDTGGDARSTSATVEELRAAAWAILHEIRSKITEATKGLTCSAGIANNFLLAKICADVNKPDGQYQLAPSRAAIVDFMDELPTRKVGGIGKVTEKVLGALGMKTMGQVRADSWKIVKAITPKISEFLLRACLGIVDGEGKSDNRSSPAAAGSLTAYSGKSLGAERTFSAISSPDEIRSKLTEICNIVGAEMKAKGLWGQCVTLKLKTNKFELFTRSATAIRYIQSAAHIEGAASKLLDKMIPITIRLLGVSMSKFKPVAGKATVDLFFKAATSPQLSSDQGASNSMCDVVSRNEPSPQSLVGSSVVAVQSSPYTPYELRILNDRNNASDDALSQLLLHDIFEVPDDDEYLEVKNGFTIYEKLKYDDKSSTANDISHCSNHTNLIAATSCVGGEVSSSSVCIPVWQLDSSSSAALSGRCLLGERRRYECPVCGLTVVGSAVDLNLHIDKCLGADGKSKTKGNLMAQWLVPTLAKKIKVAGSME